MSTYYDNEVKDRPLDFQYQLLGRLQQDCEYFLNNGRRNPKRLHQNSVAEQIALMKAIWNGFEAKPEWLSMEDIESYEKATHE